MKPSKAPRAIPLAAWVKINCNPPKLGTLAFNMRVIGTKPGAILIQSVALAKRIARARIAENKAIIHAM